MVSELPDAIRVIGLNESPVHHSVETADAEENMAGKQERVVGLVLATTRFEVIDGDDKATGLLG